MPGSAAMNSEADPNSTPNASLLFQPDSETTSRSSPSRSPRRIHTDPLGEKGILELQMKAYKRVIIFCDGTWQDGVTTQCSKYTNVLRLARSMNREDERLQPPIPQIVFYQPGVGSEHNFYSQYIEGATGSSLGDKVEEAYAFIAHNYNPGDEIFLFGFSRGAYTARMVAMFIGEIGVLDSKDMDNFASIFLNFQALGKTRDQPAKAELEAKLAPWRDAKSNGRRRVDIDGDKFTVKCLGVWDTVGSIGLPEEVSWSKGTSPARMFGFPNRKLGVHIEHAYQALALNEMRKDFNCNKFKQTETGRQNKQTLKQCWFAGSHSDIGGGYDYHDLSDISLLWMAAQVEGLLSIDIKYLRALIHPVAPWGKQKPHDSRTGVFFLADTIQRELPLVPNDSHTHETFHSSILEQTVLEPNLVEKLKSTPEFIEPLTGLEESIKNFWPYNPDSSEAQAYAASLRIKVEPPIQMSMRSTSWFTNLVRSISSSSTRVIDTNTKSGKRVSIIQRRESDNITFEINTGSPALPMSQSAQLFQRP